MSKSPRRFNSLSAHVIPRRLSSAPLRCRLSRYVGIKYRNTETVVAQQMAGDWQPAMKIMQEYGCVLLEEMCSRTK